MRLCSAYPVLRYTSLCIQQGALEKYPNIKIQLVSGYSSDYHSKDENNYLYKNILAMPYNREDLLNR